MLPRRTICKESSTENHTVNYEFQLQVLSSNSRYVFSCLPITRRGYVGTCFP